MKPNNKVHLLFEKELTALEAPELSLYDLLGVRVADLRERGVAAASAARAQRARVFHPDRLVGVPAELVSRAESIMARVNVAFAKITDPKTRALYDKYELPKTHYTCRACPGSGTKIVRKNFTSAVVEPCPACDGRVYLNKET